MGAQTLPDSCCHAHHSDLVPRLSSLRRSSKSLNLVSWPGDSRYPQVAQVTTPSFCRNEYRPHFGHFISSAFLSIGTRFSHWKTANESYKRSVVESPERMTDWFVYVVKCETGHLYTGITTDLKRRIREHNAGRGSRFTRGRLPVVLVYSERHHSRSEATKRELAIKGMAVSAKLALIGG